MVKGRNAAKAFTATRGARFGAAKVEREAAQQAAVAAGTARELVVVALSEVREDDEVALAAGGFALAGQTDSALWGSSGGQTFVRRFRTTEES